MGSNTSSETGMAGFDGAPESDTSPEQCPGAMVGPPGGRLELVSNSFFLC